MTDRISERARAHLAAWHSRRPTLAMMGEFSSGKSALLNCLLDRDLLPTRATATDMPAIWITHGPTEVVRGLTFDGNLVDLTMTELTGGRAMQYLCIRIETAAEILQRIDIIDTPGISDPRLTTEIVEEVARNVDFVVWCSTMTQAWRQTERAFWKTLPARIKPTSLMALTRADLIASTKDIERVVRRCETESDRSFAAVIPVSAPLVAMARTAATAEEAAHLLQSSGVPIFIRYLGQSIAEAEKLCAARDHLDEPESLEPLPLTAAMREPSESAIRKKKSTASKAATLAKVAPKSAKSVALLEAVKNFTPNDQGLDTIRHLFSQVSKDKSLAVEHRDVLVRALTVSEVGETRVEKFLKQVEHEIQDFADGPWCDLRQ
jgi:predicted nuclease with RNAse H fold